MRLSMNFEQVREFMTGAYFTRVTEVRMGVNVWFSAV